MCCLGGVNHCAGEGEAGELKRKNPLRAFSSVFVAEWCCRGYLGTLIVSQGLALMLFTYCKDYIFLFRTLKKTP